ncbi:MAG: Lrp/AsnC family transcriptional regulator [Candidatus Bathyarchaeia archaeon]
MDKIDLQIVQKLTADARKSFRKIAEELGISADTVMNRYASLQKEGAIRGSTIVIDPKEIGYQATVAFMLDASHANIPSTHVPPADSSTILETLIRMPNIIVATKSVGDHDLLAIGVVRDFEHLEKVKNEIARIPGVKDIQTSFWVERTALCPKYFIV